MKKIFKSIGKFLIGLALLIIALALLVSLAPWGFVEILISLFWKKRFLKGLHALGELILLLAVLVDVTGNVILQVPCNRILIKDDGYKFGSRFDTISYVLGHNQVHEKLTKTGSKLCNLLDKFEADHCAITYYNRNQIT